MVEYFWEEYLKKLKSIGALFDSMLFSPPRDVGMGGDLVVTQLSNSLKYSFLKIFYYSVEFLM
jgi:hypothetical protein